MAIQIYIYPKPPDLIMGAYHYVQTISSEPLNLFVNQLGIVVHHSPEGRPGMSDVPSCLESQGCHFGISSLVFSA